MPKDSLMNCPSKESETKSLSQPSALVFWLIVEVTHWRRSVEMADIAASTGGLEWGLSLSQKAWVHHSERVHQFRRKEDIWALVFCKTVGNPRYIYSYLVHKDLMEMMDDMDDQHRSMISKTTTRILGMTTQQVNEEILSLMSTGTCQVGSVPVILGCAYCNDSRGKGERKLANPYFGFNAVRRLGVPLAGLRWQQLETITQLMLYTSSVINGQCMWRQSQSP